MALLHMALIKLYQDIIKTNILMMSDWQDIIKTKFL